ncbi:MAG: hypothetical protein Ct9H300mP2_5100 [Candidatus Neomarinimicrobiota bacterium]|nr:MAG: hypothetical protein Ct9H300mP2_5100 [Candidatus Neomarinimicrobiota bacterium]
MGVINIFILIIHLFYNLSFNRDKTSLSPFSPHKHHNFGNHITSFKTPTISPPSVITLKSNKHYDQIKQIIIIGRSINGLPIIFSAASMELIPSNLKRIFFPPFPPGSSNIKALVVLVKYQSKLFFSNIIITVS